MELSEIKQLGHRVDEIHITNNNYHSLYREVTQKIHIETPDDIVIRFSLEPNSKFIQHQSKDNDYYIIIPNELNSVMTIYAHYFPAGLYEYEEVQNVYSEFKFTDLLKENPVNTSGYTYPIVRSGDGYTIEEGYKENSIQVKSSLPNSVDGYKNPNYKNFTDTDINDKKDMTRKGLFPLSSRFRPPYKYYSEAPDVNTNPIWKAEEAYDTICQQSPYWQVRINRDGLSPFIAETIDGQYAPMKVNLNYNYLPTSSRQHQHYYGFEGECPQKEDIFVFEGTHINEVNENFGSDKTYRVVKRTNLFDSSNSIYIDHECIRELNLVKNFTPSGFFTKNECYDYYTYTAIDGEIPHQIINLTEGQLYSLRYFIFIPSDVDEILQDPNQETPEETDFYLAVNEQRIEDEFLEYDRHHRGRWIYHEVPFLATGNDKIEIIAPRNNPKIQFFLTHVELEKFLEYSPELQYTEAGLSVTEAFPEDNFCTNKRDKASDTSVKRVPDSDVEAWNIQESTNVWDKFISLPNPQGKIFFTLNSDVTLEYDPSDTNIYYSHPNDYEYELEYQKYHTNSRGEPEPLLVQHYTDETNLYYHKQNSDPQLADLDATYPRNVRFYKGPYNSFDLYLSDVENNPITRGTVEAEFVATRGNKIDEGLAYAGKKQVRQDGTLHFDKVDLSDLDVINGQPTKYYIRIKYTDPCIEDDPIYDFKLVWVELPNIQIEPIINEHRRNRRFIGYKVVNNKPVPVYGQDCEEYKKSEYYLDETKETDDNYEMSYNQLENPSYIFDENGKKYYGGVFNHYLILDNTPFKGTRYRRGGYYIYDVESEFPLKIVGHVHHLSSTNNQQDIKGGYCELSVDDKVIQTTIVDAYGMADFYLDVDDVPLNKHTIKIEYYNKFWEPMKYIYFDLVICDDPTVVRPAVPVIFKNFPYCPGYVKTDDSTQCKFAYLQDITPDLYIPQDDTLLLDLDNTQKHENFKISVYRHKNGFTNISKFTNQNSTLVYEKKVGSSENDIQLLLFYALGSHYDTYCTLSPEGVEGQHPKVTGQTESTQIETYRDNIKDHGKNPTKDMSSYFSTVERQIGDTLFISPETMGDVMLYAPIVDVETGGDNNPLWAHLFDYYRKNFAGDSDGLENIIRYSIVTDNISGTKYRTFRRDIKIHYMNYIEANNYEITWEDKDNGTPFYASSEDEEGYWEFKSLEIKKKINVTNKNNDIHYVDNENDFINEGKIEVYQNGEMYHYVPKDDETGKYKINKILKKTANDTFQLRYVFKDGYHFVVIDNED